MAVCIAVIAKENYPLYIRSTPTENELKFHYMVHTSLDVVDEKISAMGKALVDQRELYLGLLYPTEDYKVYGYVTNSKVKFVMVVDSSNTALRDNEIRSMFRKLHNSYTDVMCNPFYNPGDRIQSRWALLPVSASSPGGPYSRVRIQSRWALLPVSVSSPGGPYFLCPIQSRWALLLCPIQSRAFDNMVTSMMIQVC
ncbi:trafficking protein particle complex subunit 2-like protein isoform X14 [Macaca mulatta]